METPESPVKKPSLFLGGLIGYLAASLVGSIVCWFLAVRSSDFDNQRSFTVLVCTATLGVLAGYRVAVRKRQRLDVNEPSVEWQQFFGSWTFYWLIGLVLAGSFVISALESLLFDVVYGAPWLGNE